MNEAKRSGIGRHEYACKRMKYFGRAAMYPRFVLNVIVVYNVELSPGTRVCDHLITGTLYC